MASASTASRSGRTAISTSRRISRPPCSRSPSRDGKAGAVTALKTSRPLDHADAMRTFGDSLLLIEGNGKLDKVTIKGEEALIEIIRTASPNGPRKTLYNRYVRWAAKGVWVDLFRALGQAGG